MILEISTSSNWHPRLAFKRPITSNKNKKPRQKNDGWYIKKIIAQSKNKINK